MTFQWINQMQLNWRRFPRKIPVANEGLTVGTVRISKLTFPDKLTVIALLLNNLQNSYYIPFWWLVQRVSYHGLTWFLYNWVLVSPYTQPITKVVVTDLWAAKKIWPDPFFARFANIPVIQSSKTLMCVVNNTQNVQNGDAIIGKNTNNYFTQKMQMAHNYKSFQKVVPHWWKTVQLNPAVPALFQNQDYRKNHPTCLYWKAI